MLDQVNNFPEAGLSEYFWLIASKILNRESFFFVSGASGNLLYASDAFCSFCKQQNLPLSVPGHLNELPGDFAMFWNNRRQSLTRNMPVEIPLGPVPLMWKVVQVDNCWLWMNVLRDFREDVYLRYKAIFQSSFQFTAVLSKEGICLEINDTVLNYSGYDKNETIGINFWDGPFWPETSEIELIRDAVLKAAKGMVVVAQLKIINKDGRFAFIDFSVKPIFDSWNQVLYLLAEGRDISDYVLKNKALTRITNLLNEAQAISKVGGWELSLKNRKLFWTDELKNIFPHERFPWDNWDGLLQFFSEKDQAKLNDDLFRKVRMGLPFETELLMNRGPGPDKWLRILAKPVPTESGIPQRVQGVFQDITEKKLGDAHREKTERLIQHIADAVFELNVQANITFVSPSSETLLGRPSYELIGSSLFDWIHPNDRSELDFLLQRIQERGRLLHLQFRFCHPIKGVVYVEANAVHYTSDHGQGMFMITARDVTQRVELQKRIEAQEKILEAVARANVWLLREPSLSGAILKALECLGPATGVDRICVFKNELIESHNKNATVLWQEWVSGNGNSRMLYKETDQIPFDEIPDFIQLLSEGNPFKAIVQHIPDEKLKKLLQARNIFSLLVLPVFVKNKFWGFLGFDDCNLEREWTDAEVNVLSSFTENVAAAITRNELEEELVSASLKAREASRLKTEFLTNMSHEIRTPLNAIIGFSGLLQNTQLDREQGRYVYSLQAASRNLLHLINDILDVSRIEAGKLHLEEEKTDLRELLQQAMEMILYQASQQKLRLVMDIAPDLPEYVLCDGMRLQQIFVNLLGNAVKFTSEGEISLSLHWTPLESEETSAIFHFSVSDTGIGIPQEKQSHILGLFTQADTSITRKYGGTGLGLNIVYNLLKLMGSQLECESEPGRGTRFSFSLRMPCALPEQPPVLPVSKYKKVLVCEPHERSRMLLRKWLEWVGLEVFDCAVPDDIEKNTNFQPDLRILDEDVWRELHFRQEKMNISKTFPGFTLLLSDSAEMEKYTENVAEHMYGVLIRPIQPIGLYKALENLGNRKGKYLDSSGHIVENAEIDYSAHSVMIVEDNELNILLIENVLQRNFPGLNITTARNGKEALENFISRQPDLILMDIQMPEMDGIEATRQIRSIEKRENRGLVPVIALTAGVLYGDREQALQAGMQDYLAKPFDENVLCQLIHAHLAVRRNVCEKMFWEGFNHAFDRCRLQEQFGNDLEYVWETFSKFNELISADITGLSEAITSQDAQNSRRILHKIRSNFTLVGLSELQARCARMENQLKKTAHYPLEEMKKLQVSIEVALKLIEAEKIRLEKFKSNKQC